MKKILIIEDNVDSADMLSMLLELQGHLVHCASSGHAGLSLAAMLHPDIIITDLGLPDMNGITVLRGLAAVPTTTPCLVIALTGEDGVNVRHDAQEAGVDHFFVKGEEINDLLSLIGKSS